MDTLLVFEAQSKAYSFFETIGFGQYYHDEENRPVWFATSEEIEANGKSSIYELIDKDVWVDQESGLYWSFSNPDFWGIKEFWEGATLFPDAHHPARRKDWRLPSIVELKTLSSVIPNDRGEYVKSSASERISGCYEVGTPNRDYDNYPIWDFKSGALTHQHYHEGSIVWGSEGSFSGFEESGYTVSNRVIYVCGNRRLYSDWCERLIEFFKENPQRSHPATEEEMLLLEQVELSSKANFIPDDFDSLFCLNKIIWKGVPNELPDVIYRLDGLQHLELSGAERGKEINLVLSDKIGSLKSLKTLILSDFKSIILPESLQKAANLRELSLARTGLKSLPSHVGSIKSLESLTLAENNILQFPNEILNLKNLKKLNIARTSFECLPNAFEQLCNLEELNACDSSLRLLPDSIGKLESLKILNVSGSNLIDLPDDLSGMVSLEFLYIAGTGIHAFPASVCSLRKLKVIDISKTLIRSFPPNLCTSLNPIKIKVADINLYYPIQKGVLDKLSRF